MALDFEIICQCVQNNLLKAGLRDLFYIDAWLFKIIFYHDMQISWPDSGLVPAPTTVKLPHASGHSSGNRQGHVTKIKTHRFEIFVAFRFTNV